MQCGFHVLCQGMAGCSVNGKDHTNITHDVINKQKLQFPQIQLGHIPLYFILIYLKTCHWTV